MEGAGAVGSDSTSVQPDSGPAQTDTAQNQPSAPNNTGNDAGNNAGAANSGAAQNNPGVAKNQPNLVLAQWNGTLDKASKANAAPVENNGGINGTRAINGTRDMNSVPQIDGKPTVGPWQQDWQANLHAQEKYTQAERDRQWEIADPGHNVSAERKQAINGSLTALSKKDGGLTADSLHNALQDKEMTNAEQRYMLQQAFTSGKLDLPNMEKLAQTASQQNSRIIPEQLAARAIGRSQSGYLGWANRSDVERRTYANLAMQSMTGDKEHRLSEYDYGRVQHLVNSLGEDGARSFTSELRTGTGASVADSDRLSRERTINDKSPLPQPEAERRLLTSMIAAPNTPTNATSDPRGAVLQAFGRSPQYDLNQFKAPDGKTPLAKTEGQRIGLASLVAQYPNLNQKGLEAIQDRAMMANSSYLKDVDHPELGLRNTLPSYIERVDVNNHPQLKAAGITDKNFNNKDTGFAASLFHNTRDGTDTYALVPRGTDDPQTFLNLFRGDWGNSIDQGADGWASPFPLSKQYNEQMSDLSKKLKGALGDKLTDMTGHSLGGGLASEGGMLTKTQATTFDSAGLNTYTIKRNEGKWDESKTNSYRLRGEALTYYQEQHWLGAAVAPIAAGRQYTLEPLDAKGNLAWLNHITRDDLHGTDYLLNSLFIDPKNIGR